ASAIGFAPDANSMSYSTSRIEDIPESSSGNTSGLRRRSWPFSYACSDSLLLTPLCCDDIHDVTPRVSALAGCDSIALHL
ncbi:hypothetical protein Tco_0398726, partial [Tanacetum coccineum]